MNGMVRLFEVYLQYCKLIIQVLMNIGKNHLQSLSMILTVAQFLMYSPTPSRPAIKAGFDGVNSSSTLSLYSRAISSFAVNRRMSTGLLKVIGCNCSKSKLPETYKYWIYCYESCVFTCSSICSSCNPSANNKT